MTPEEARKKRRHRNERIAAAVLVLVLASVVVFFIRWNRTEEEALRADRRYIPLPARITPEVLMLRDYVRIDTSTVEGQRAGARWLAAELAKRGVTAELIESGPGRLNVYARLRGKQPGNGLLLFNHIDVVGADPAAWQRPPFAGEIFLNQLWGRGTLDMKALAICQLLAFAGVARGGRQPEHDLVFLATAEEEAGSENGMKWLLANRPDLFEGIAYGITEGGITEVMTERMTYFGIEVGSKQIVTVYLSHETMEPLNAARIALEPWITPVEPDRILPEVRTFFADVAPTRKAFKPFLADIDGTLARGDFWRLPFTYRELMQNTVRVTAPFHDGNRWSVRVILINLPDENPDARAAWLKEQVAPYGVIFEIRQKEGPVPSSPARTPLFDILAREAKRLYKAPAGSEVLYRSTSDCRFLRPRGIACYGVSPYLVDFAQSASIHGADERIRLDWFMDGVEYIRNAVTTWANTR
ncbi:MAG TPA: M20/M25/M40 family metallo-hydrolase [Thermoanaerobaculia bacterium]|nr:M20/M25/M40 family metallo-hydrolase [Thermoanaerobaculia bacterium]